LLSAFSSPQLQHLQPILADKKKYELWAEELLPDLNFEDLVDRLKGEKKKVELEKLRVERLEDPREGLIRPEIIEQIAEAVASRLKG